MSLWLVMIILHAISATVCFVAGIAIISPERARRQTWLLPTFILSLIGLIIFMIAAMAAHWYDISNVERIAFSGLVILGLYMLYRALQARKRLRSKIIAENYVNDVGFTLISLFNGFIIVALIDLQAPAWMVIAGAIIGIIVGSKGIALAKRRYL